MLLGPESI